MKLIAGIILCIAGVVCGLYFGLWWAFIGGIIDCIDAFKADDIEAMAVAVGIVKVLFASVIGWGSAAVLLIPGYVLATDAK